MAKSPLVGIDLGTTYSLVSVLQGGVPTVLPNATGDLLTPSAVSLTDAGEVLVGAAARARSVTHPSRTAVAFKRDMGTNKLFDLGLRKFTAPELSALVLKSLKRDAEAALGHAVEEAVVTVPAYFGDAQRQATRAAGEMAGLVVERIINEPTAAAMAYGLHERDREIRAVVLDLGGGTFDVTCLEIVEGIIEIQASSGDARLGGEDFADVLAELAARRLQEEHRVDVRDDPRAWARLREACDGAKKRLTTSDEVVIALPALPLGRRTVDVEQRVTRDMAEEAWIGLLERVRAPIVRALRDAKLAPERVDEVLLVGGATRMPAFVRLAAQIFGKMPQRRLPPDEAVAMGAAVQAALKGGDAAVDDLVVTDVAPFTLGIATSTSLGRQRLEGVFSPIIERGTTIPTSRSKSFQTAHDMQKQIAVEIFQGEHSLCRDNQFLGRYTVEVEAAPAGDQSIDVRFSYDLNGILEVDTTVRATGQIQSMVIEQSPGRLTKEEVEKARAELAKLKFHPREALPNTTALARAEQLFAEVTGSDRDELGFAMTHFRLALEAQDPAEIEIRRAILVRIVNSLGR